jgi:hypothetical protein
MQDEVIALRLEVISILELMRVVQNDFAQLGFDFDVVLATAEIVIVIGEKASITLLPDEKRLPI